MCAFFMKYILSKRIYDIVKVIKNIYKYTFSSGGQIMNFSYKKLWKLLIDKNMNKTELREAIGVTPATLARLSKNQNVTMNVIGKICNELDCNIEDIVEYIGNDDLK